VCIRATVWTSKLLGMLSSHLQVGADTGVATRGCRGISVWKARSQGISICLFLRGRGG
jgi:hypothetical protein